MPRQWPDIPGNVPVWCPTAGRLSRPWGLRRRLGGDALSGCLAFDALGGPPEREHEEEEEQSKGEIDDRLRAVVDQGEGHPSDPEGNHQPDHPPLSTAAVDLGLGDRAILWFERLTLVQ